MSERMWKISRYWNRIAYSILRIGQCLIWDYTGDNDYLLSNDEVATKYSEHLMCRSDKP